MKDCVHCGHKVSGGDRHSLLNCPPKRGRNGSHWAMKKARKKAARKEKLFHTARGVAVAGTGVPKGE